MIYERLIRPLLFRLDAETSHHFALRGLAVLNRLAAPRRWLRQRLVPDDPRLAVTLFGQSLPHPVGLAAGFDKNGRVVPVKDPNVAARIDVSRYHASKLHGRGKLRPALGNTIRVVLRMHGGCASDYCRDQ